MANNNEKETFDAAVKSEAFFEKNKKIIAGVIIAVIVVVAGYLCYNQFIGGPRQDKASTALAMGQEYFNADQFDKALNGDGANYQGRQLSQPLRRSLLCQLRQMAGRCQLLGEVLTQG